MTTYYLSLKAGQVPSQANVAEATSSPTADVVLTLGGGAVPEGNLSRGFVLASLLAFIAYINGDDPMRGGADVLALMP